MPTRELARADELARTLYTLGEPTRLRILHLLSDGVPRTVGQIAGGLKGQVVLISHHLGVLRTAGILDSTRDGRFMRYNFCEGVLTPTGLLIDGFRFDWPD